VEGGLGCTDWVAVANVVMNGLMFVGLAFIAYLAERARMEARQAVRDAVRRDSP
jgi:preprotein translocase subunit YajC